MMSVTVWETMTVKEMVVHLFLEQSDATMLKAAMKVLAALRTKVAEIMLQNNWGPCSVCHKRSHREEWCHQAGEIPKFVCLF